jgi:hypothetical protein
MDKTDEQALAFLRRSYAAVDGLWFMQAEKELGFERALELDRDVWQVMPKIQARWLKHALGQEHGLSALHTCLSARLRWEGYGFEARWGDEGRSLEIAIQDCPWRRLLIHAGRESLAARIGPLICGAEYALWASEFGADLSFTLGPTACQGAVCCLLRFEERGEAAGPAEEDSP